MENEIPLEENSKNSKESSNFHEGGPFAEDAEDIENLNKYMEISKEIENMKKFKKTELRNMKRMIMIQKETIINLTEDNKKQKEEIELLKKKRNKLKNEYVKIKANAIKKYGFNNFQVSILKEGLSKQEADY